MTIAARATGLTKTYGQGTAKVVALDSVDFEVVQGEFTAIMGPSGSGKSTLMHLLAALDTPTAGSVHIGDTDVASLKDTPLTELRRDRIGFIFQAFNLVPTLTARENIVLPLAIAGRKVDEDWFGRIVDVLGLADRLTHKPSELSGGQQQRVACARALMNRPDIVFGDEPTGNLDSTSAAEVLAFLRRSVDEFSQTVVMVTHDAHAASYADRAVFLSDGRIVDEMRGATQEELLLAMSRIYPRHDVAEQVDGVPFVAPTASSHLRETEGVGESHPRETEEVGESHPRETEGMGESHPRETEEVGESHPRETEVSSRPEVRAAASLEGRSTPADEQPANRSRFAAEIYREGGPDPDSDPDLEEPTIEQSMPRRALMD